MPATSRSGERFRRRSGSDRAGSPSKSRITQSFEGAHSVWPRWKSPWCRMIRPLEPACVIWRSRSRISSPRCPDRLERLQVVREVEEGSLDLLVDRRGEQAERLQARLLRGEGRIRRVRGEAGVHRAGHLAEPAQAAEEAFRRLDQLVQRQLPPVAARPARTPGGRRASTPRAGRGTRTSRAAPARSAKSCSLRKRSISSSGLMPGLQAAVDLEDQLARRTRRSVFDCSLSITRTVASSAPTPAKPSTTWKKIVPPSRVQLRGAGADPLDELARDPRLGQAVEPVAGDELVGVVRPLGEADLDERDHRAGQLRAVDDGRMRDLAPLRAVPPLRGDVLDERLFGQVGRGRHSSFRAGTRTTLAARA